MVRIDDRTTSQSRGSRASPQTDGRSDNIINLSDYVQKEPTPATAAENLETKILEHRGLAIMKIDAVIQRLSSLQGRSIPATADGVAALKSARRILSSLDVGAPDFCVQLNFVAVQLDLLAKALWQTAKAQNAMRRNSANAIDDTSDGRPAED